MSRERRSLLKALGAELVLTPAAKGMQGAIDRAKELREEHPNSYIPGQFTNPANAEAHRRTTAQEILRDMDGRWIISFPPLVQAARLPASARCSKRMIRKRALSPWSPPLRQCSPAESRGRIKIQGIGAGFVPEVLNTEIYDEIITVENDDAFSAARLASQTEGLLVGISRAQRCMPQSARQTTGECSKTIVVLLPDTGGALPLHRAV